MYFILADFIDATEAVPTGGNTDGFYTTYPQHVKPGRVAGRVFMYVHYVSLFDVILNVYVIHDVYMLYDTVLDSYAV